VHARLFVAVAVLHSCAASGAWASPATLRLAPACQAGTDEPSAFDVTFSLTADAGRSVAFRLDDRVFGSAGMTLLIEGEHASDDAGRVPLVRSLKTSPDRETYLELETARPPAGALTFHYRARSVAASENGSTFGLRHDRTGLGGLGASFLLLPATAQINRARVEWDAPRCAPDATTLVEGPPSAGLNKGQFSGPTGR
jgi:hypothetical protein